MWTEFVFVLKLCFVDVAKSETRGNALWPLTVRNKIIFFLSLFSYSKPVDQIQRLLCTFVFLLLRLTKMSVWVFFVSEFHSNFTNTLPTQTETSGSFAELKVFS